jgi:hypothetical protein
MWTHYPALEINSAAGNRESSPRVRAESYPTDAQRRARYPAHGDGERSNYLHAAADTYDASAVFSTSPEKAA